MLLSFEKEEWKYERDLFQLTVDDRNHSVDVLCTELQKIKV